MLTSGQGRGCWAAGRRAGVYKVVCEWGQEGAYGRLVKWGRVQGAVLMMRQSPCMYSGSGFGGSGRCSSSADTSRLPDSLWTLCQEYMHGLVDCARWCVSSAAEVTETPAE